MLGIAQNSMYYTPIAMYEMHFIQLWIEMLVYYSVWVILTEYFELSFVKIQQEKTSKTSLNE